MGIKPAAKFSRERIQPAKYVWSSEDKIIIKLIIALMIECLHALSYLIFAPNLENKHYRSILYMSKMKFRETLMKGWFGVGELSLCPDSLVS